MYDFSKIACFFFCDIKIYYLYNYGKKTFKDNLVVHNYNDQYDCIWPKTTGNNNINLAVGTTFLAAVIENQSTSSDQSELSIQQYCDINRMVLDSDFGTPLYFPMINIIYSADQRSHLPSV